MFCKNCGKEVKEGEKFCRECGTSLDNNTTGKKVEPITVNNTTATPAANPGKGLAIASLVIGIASFIFGWFLIPLPILGLILGIVQKGKSGEKTAGIILNSISLGLIVTVYLIIGTALVTFVNNITECEGEDCITDVFEDENAEEKTGEILDSLRPWNLYKYLRTGKLGKENNINGGWRYLGSSKEYWTFNNGEFYWYKDVDNREDNYYFGTYTVVNGKDGLSTLGIDQERIDKFTSNLGDSVSDSDIYSLVLKPTKLIVDGTDTNAGEGTEFRAVWVLIDHGVDGIEGQVYHVEDNQTAYYVKLED